MMRNNMNVPLPPPSPHRGEGKGEGASDQRLGMLENFSKTKVESRRVVMG